MITNRFFSIFDRLRKNDMVKILSFVSLSYIIKLMTGIIGVKVISIIVGPFGVAIIGQLNSFMLLVNNFATGGVTSGVTKYVAENKDDMERVRLYISTAFKITLICSLFVAVVLLVFHVKISRFVMLSAEYGYVFIILGCTIFFYALNSLLLSIINGYKEFKYYVKINMAGSILGLFFTVLFVSIWNLRGALISTVSYQSIMVLVTIWMGRKLFWMKVNSFFKKFNVPILKNYLHYSLMTFVAIMMLPVSQLILRRYVISNISGIEAGWWEAMNRMSSVYLTLFTSSFGVYYTPRLCELKNIKEFHCEIVKIYKIIIPLLIAGLGIIYLFRTFIIQILFSYEFMPMVNLFVWQQLGDFFKISSWILAYIMGVKRMTRTFISTEIIFSFLFLGLAFYFLKTNGIVGIVQAYLVNYIIYFILMLVIFRHIVFYKDK